MSNINFDNAWLLLLAIPLLIIVLIPYLFATNKDSRTKNSFISTILHLVIAVLVAFVLAGPIFEHVATKTTIYVLADVSHSTDNNYAKIDEYIDELKDNAPRNSEIGVICFGRDAEVLVEPGRRLKSVRNHQVETDATDIAKAFKFANEQFEDNVIKRIVLISDGEETFKSDIVEVVDSLNDEGVYIDAIYLDSNLPSDVNEVQMYSYANYVNSTFMNNDESANLLIQANNNAKAIVTITLNGSEYERQSLSLYAGYNPVEFKLKTDEEGTFNYEVKVETVLDSDDTSKLNNSFKFSQKVTEKANVLVIAGSENRGGKDLKIFEKLYKDVYHLTLYRQNTLYKVYRDGMDVTPANKNEISIPYLIEDLIQYDEFILSDIDVTLLKNHTEFVRNLNACVANFGKSLITFGNVYTRNDSNNGDDALISLKIEEDRLIFEDFYGLGRYSYTVVNHDTDPAKRVLKLEHLSGHNHLAKQHYEFILTDRNTLELLALKQPYATLKRVDINENLKPDDYTDLLGSFEAKDVKGNDSILNTLNQLVPTKFGNDNQDKKMVAVVLDISRSMEMVERLQMAKNAAKNSIDLLNDGDMVTLVGFYGEIDILEHPIRVNDEVKAEIKEAIDLVKPRQGTSLGAALDEAYKVLMNYDSFQQKEVILISDGKPHSASMEVSRSVAVLMKEAGIRVTSINTFEPLGEQLLTDIANITGGNYYFANGVDSIDNLFDSAIKDEITDTEIVGDFKLDLALENADVLKDVPSLPNISGFFYNRAKSTADAIITTTYVSPAGINHIIPIYAVANYSTGKVASLATSVGNDWTTQWASDDANIIDTNVKDFLLNIINSNRPDERIETAYIVDVEMIGSTAAFKVSAPSLDLNTTLKAEIKAPNASEAYTQVLAFNSEIYEMNIDASYVGDYEINFIYSSNGIDSKPMPYNLHIAYQAEYDDFTKYDISNLDYMISSDGEVSVNAKLKLENTNSEVKKYILDLTPILMISAVILFVADIMVRKLRWADIKALFKKKEKVLEGGKKKYEES